MMNMNLSTEQTGELDQSRASSSWGLIIISIVFVLTAAAAGGLILWKNTLTKQMNDAEAAYQAKYDQLIKEKRNADVADFQKRITMANDLVKEKNMILENVQFVERSVVPGLYLTKYENDKKTKMLKLEGVADKYETVAKQVLSLKASDAFSSVDVTKVDLSPKGEINFSMEIKVN